VNRVVLIKAGPLIQARSLIKAGGLKPGASIRGNTVILHLVDTIPACDRRTHDEGMYHASIASPDKN